LDTPLGEICITAGDKGIRSLEFTVESNLEKSYQPNEWSKNGAIQLSEYFNKERIEFELEYDFQGYSEFYKSVWQRLLLIDYGTTCSYLDIAKSINNPKSVRAVGMANGKNPIGIIIPCHRVIGADGSLTGYAQGLEMKKWLLEFEGAIKPTSQLALF